MASNADYIIGVIIVASIFAYGGHQAFGETFTNVVEFPVPDDYEEVQIHKQLTRQDAEMIEFTVTYRIMLGTPGGEEFYGKLIDEQKRIECPFGYDTDTLGCLDEITPKVIIPPVVLDADGNEISPYVIKMQQEELDKYSEAHKLCLAEPPTDYDGKKFCALVAERTLCYRGENEARGITQGSFVTSDADILNSGEFPEPSQMDDALAKLSKAKLECDYQKDILEAQQLGPEALEKGKSFGVIEPSHSERAVIPEFWIGGVPNHEPYKLDAHDFIDEKENAFDSMCENDQFELKSKLDLGCDVVREYQLENDGSCREDTRHNEDKTACIIPKRIVIEGGITYGNYLTDARDRFDISDAEQKAKIQYQQRQEFDEAHK